MLEWKFMPYAPGEIKQNPTQSEFFTTTEVGNIANGLVREGIQNSLDEPIVKNSTNDSAVKIRIFLSGDKYALPPSDYKMYVESLEEHLKARNNGMRHVPDFEQDAMKYLVFEDFNTNGLLGLPNESKDIEIEDKSKAHNFYHFWRNVGITGKPEDKLGRWGVGKTVFPVSSTINTFWGLTIQSDTRKRYLMGQSVLKSHNIDRNRADYGYRPYGYFANFDTDGFPKAIEAEEVLDNFSSAFHLKRKINDSGLSIVIPFYRDEITFNSIVTSVILQYYFPLLKKELQVEVEYEDEKVVIIADNINNIVNTYWDDTLEDLPSKNSVIALLKFIKWADSLGAAEFFNLKEQPVKNQPRWNDKLWADITADELIDFYEKNEKIAFKVPVKFEQADNPNSAKTCWFKVFLEKDEEIKEAETHYVRDNITIIDIKSIKNPGVRAMVLVDDRDLSNLLGDSENPAHTQWQKDSQNFIGKYKDGDKCITFVINSLNNIFQKLQKPAKGLEKDILKNIFFIPIEEEPEQSNLIDDDSSLDDEPGGPDIPPLPPAKRQTVRIKKIPGGINIYPIGITKDNLPEITLKLAYDTTRGNPLKKYRPLDFELNRLPIITKPHNCIFSIPVSNEIRLIPQKEDFELTITGFDENRDLFVNIKTQYPTDDKEV